MSSGEQQTQATTGQPHLQKQDLSQLDISKLTPLSPEVISRQATINIGTIGHVAHGKSTVVKAISGVQTVRFKNELERNITIKLEPLSDELIDRLTTSPAELAQYIKMTHERYKIETPPAASGGKRRRDSESSPSSDGRLKQAKISNYFYGNCTPTTADAKLKQRNIEFYFNRSLNGESNAAKLGNGHHETSHVADHDDDDDADSVISVISSSRRSLRSITPSSSRVSSRRKSITSVISEGSTGSPSTRNQTGTKSTPQSDSSKKRKLHSNPKANKSGEYSVEEILDIQEISSAPYFHIKWRGYSSKSNTWEPLNNIRTCNSLQEFLQYEVAAHQDVINEIREDITKTEDYQEKLKAHNAKSFKEILDEYEKFDPLGFDSDLILFAKIRMNDCKNKRIYERILANIGLEMSYRKRHDQLVKMKEFEDMINEFEPSSKIVLENLQDFDVPHQLDFP